MAVKINVVMIAAAMQDVETLTNCLGDWYLTEQSQDRKQAMVEALERMRRLVRELSHAEVKVSA